MNTYNTCIPLILGGFPCSQAYNVLTCDQPHTKDNFLPIKKKRNFDPFWGDGPLKSKFPVQSRALFYRRFVITIPQALFHISWLCTCFESSLLHNCFKKLRIFDCKDSCLNTIAYFIRCAQFFFINYLISCFSEVYMTNSLAKNSVIVYIWLVFKAEVGICRI